MRSVTTKESEVPEVRADEVAICGGSLFGDTDWLVLNEEDITYCRKEKQIIRRRNKRKRARGKWDE